MVLRYDTRPTGEGLLLYPMMVIAAIAAIAFSLAGIATVTGWMPSEMIHGSAANEERAAARDTSSPATSFGCAECGVIESIREIENRSAS